MPAQKIFSKRELKIRYKLVQERYRSSPKGIATKKAWTEKYRDRKSEAERVLRYRKYGITVDEYDAMLESQNNKCASCKKEASAFSRRLAIDHCHKTGQVRGLLCFHCNSTLGKFGDDPKYFRMIANYLEENKCQQGMKS